MTEAGAGGLLDNEEVEFLLQADQAQEEPGAAPSPKGEEPGDEPEDEREVTMRGDLDKIELADIFQTLSMSKMEGMLRVRNPLEQRQLIFKDGYVQCIVPNRVETRRLGQRLIQAGVLTADQLRSCLLLQKKSRKPLGVILAEEGHVNETDIENMVVDQVQEELFSLFTWKQGTFEFYKGPISNQELKRRIETTPEFEVGGVLLEVARRSDEWELIMDTLDSLEEIFEPIEGNDGELASEAETVLAATNGHMSVRDLADATLLPLFECARAMRQLVQEEWVGRISLATGIENAETRLSQGDVKRAVVIVQTLASRSEALDTDTVTAMAAILNRCGEAKTASTILLDHARELDSPGEAISLARQARKLSIRSHEVLEFLFGLLVQLPSPDADELNDVATDLIDCLLGESLTEDALDLIQRLEERGLDTPNNRAKKARILTKLDRKEEAIEELLTLAEVYKSERRQEKLAAIYEQILKIDYRRKDIAKSLKSLHAGKMVQRMKLGGAIAAALLLSLFGFLHFQDATKEHQIELAAAEIRKRIAADDLPGASSLIQDTTTEHGPHPILAGLETSIARSLAAKAREKNSVRGKKLAEISEEAKTLLDKGLLKEAINAYFKLKSHGQTAEKIEEIIRGRVLALVPDLEKWALELPHKIPAPPSNMQRREQFEATITEIDSQFPTRCRKIATAVLTSAKDDRFKAILGLTITEKLVGLATTVKESADQAQVVRNEYVKRLDRNAIARGLTPIFEAAKRHELACDFDAALKNYRILDRDHPSDDDLARHFKRKIEDLSTIIRFMQVISKATKKGDFNTAQGQLYSLKQAYPNIPFDELAYLPVWIETNPPNAKVTLNGKTATGHTPLLARFLPSQKTRVVVELEGFYPEERTLRGDRLGRLTSLLSKMPAWISDTNATVDRPPVVDENDRIFLSNRAGDVLAFNLKDGNQLWRAQTDDLSGFLSRPALLGKAQLLVASVDGKLRCLNRSNGQLIWEVDDLPCQTQPLVTDKHILLATHDGRLVRVSHKGKASPKSITLKGKVMADIIRAGKNAIVATTDGEIYLVNPDSLSIVRQSNAAGRGIICTPAFAKDSLVVVTDEGRITAFDGRNLKTRWQVKLKSELTRSPAISGGRVFVADDRKLLCFDLDTGRPVGKAISCETQWSSHLAAGHGKIFAGEHNGLIHVFDAKTLEPAFLIRNEKHAIAPVYPIDHRRVLATFSDRTLQVFTKLP